MTDDRALEIIASFGADAARWPDAERAALLASIDRPAVAAALADARALDALLVGWARADFVAAPFDATRLAAPAVVRPPAHAMRRRWLAAGAVAAAVAAVVALVPMQPVAPIAPMPQLAVNAPQPPAPAATAGADGGSDPGFAYVFTPTVDEDALI